MSKEDLKIRGGFALQGSYEKAYKIEILDDSTKLWFQTKETFTMDRALELRDQILGLRSQ